jgi:uncharacterized protein YggE
VARAPAWHAISARLTAWPATQLAELAGADLGDVVAIQEGGGAMPPTPKFARQMAMDSAVPIEVGTQSVAVDVTVTYRLTTG